MPKKDDNEQNAEPDYDGAAKLIKAAIQTANDQKAKILGDLSAAWKRIEDNFHVNKKAAKDVIKLMSMSASSRNEYLRDFNSMLEALGLEYKPDLVDQAEGKEGDLA